MTNFEPLNFCHLFFFGGGIRGKRRSIFRLLELLGFVFTESSINRCSQCQLSFSSNRGLTKRRRRMGKGQQGETNAMDV